MGAFIDKHLSPIGGFSTRHGIEEFIAMIPDSDIAECDGILKNLIQDFREQGIRSIWAAASKQTGSGLCFEFGILSGLAQGQPFAEMEEVINLAKKQQKEIGRFRCIDGGMSQ